MIVYLYEYDNRGNIISDTKRNTSGMEYDFRNLPLTMQKGAETLKYRYDETGNRILKRAGGKTEYYVRDHSGLEVGIYDKDDGWTSFNLFGNGLIGRADVYYQSVWVEDPEEGMVEVQQRIDERFYYIKDHLGSIRVTIDQTNQVTAAQDYSAYGEIWRSLNSSTPGDRYKFTEKELDIETGYAYHGARYYDPWRITWNSPDPLEDKYPGWSSYNYCIDNPSNYFDPDGENPITGLLIGAGLEIAVQIIIEGRSIEDLDVGAIGVSAAMGAVGFGIADKFNKIRKIPGVSQLIDICMDAIGSIAHQLVENGEVDLEKTSLDVIFGQLARKFDDIVNGNFKSNSKRKMNRDKQLKDRKSVQDTEQGQKRNGKYKKSKEEYDNAVKASAITVGATSGAASSSVGGGNEKEKE